MVKIEEIFHNMSCTNEEYETQKKWLQEQLNQNKIEGSICVTVGKKYYELKEETAGGDTFYMLSNEVGEGLSVEPQVLFSLFDNYFREEF